MTWMRHWATVLPTYQGPTATPEQVVGHVVDLMIAQDKALIPVIDPTTDALRGIITKKDLLTVRRAAGVLERDRARFYARRRTGVERAS